MSDVFTPEKRSKVMAAIRSTGNKDTELKVAAILRLNRITGWRRRLKLLGKPDFVFRRERVVIFVDGCFWHGCPRHGRRPHAKPEYWVAKLARNRARDIAVSKALRTSGWTVVRIWEHELQDPQKVLAKIRNAFLSSPILRAQRK